MIKAVTQKFEPILKDKPAFSRKDAELHGESANVYGSSASRRKDASLMANGADWKNTQTQALLSSSPQKKGKHDHGDQHDHKTKHYQQLQSSVFGGGYEQGAPVFDREAGKASFGTGADWKTSGMSKPINKGPTRADTYLQRQKQLSSTVLEQTDYYAYMPLKKDQVDYDNFGKDYVHKPKGLKGSLPEHQAGSQTFSPPKPDYNPKSMTSSMLSSVFDKPVTRVAAQEDGPAPATFKVPGRETFATKQAFLASNDLVTGKSTLHNYDAVKEPPRVVDLTVAGLPEHMDARELKRISGAKHVISTTVDEDRLKGTCTGTGRIQIRLNQGETQEGVTLNFVKNGWTVQEYAQDNRKCPDVTAIPKEKPREITDARVAKQQFLSSQMPEATGNSGSYQVRF